MQIKLEFISTKEPKWHIFYKKQPKSNEGDVIVYKCGENELASPDEITGCKSNMGDINQYLTFFGKVMYQLTSLPHLLPFKDDNISTESIIDKIISKVEAVVQRAVDNNCNFNGICGICPQNCHLSRNNCSYDGYIKAIYRKFNISYLQNNDTATSNNNKSSSPVILTSDFCEDTFSRPIGEESEKVARPDSEESKPCHSEQSEESKIDEYKLQAEHAAMQQIAELNTAKIIDTEKEQKNNEERQALIAKASRLTGRVEAFNFISNLATVSQLMIIKNIKESGVYKELPNINTWEEYCNSLGFSKRHIDEKLENLNTLGTDFLETVSQFGLGYRELRQLRKQVKTGSLEVHEAEVIIDGETISLSETEQLKDALTDLILKNQEEKKQHKAELKAKDKTIQTYADAAERAKEEEKKAKALADKYKDDIAHFFSGRISKVAECDRSDFQDIVNLEKDFEQLNIGLSNLLKKDYSEFNANMFCSLLGKMIIAIDSARIQASSKYNLFNFDAGILSNEERRELDNGVTPLDFLDE